MSEPLDLETAAEDFGEEEVAIVGMAGRFPGAPGLEDFWRNLRDGVESISTFTGEELLAAGVAPELLAHPRYVRARGVLAGADLFDAPFFGFSPREAALTDPQHRVLLECAWEALEQAGIDPDTCTGRIGVYAGSLLSTYLLFHLLPRVAAEDEEAWQMVLANDKDTLSTRLSYKLNLRGPSVTVQTACSTALVAVHMARQSLLDYECDVALAGGVAVRSPQTAGYLYQEEGILSPDGHCRAFDAQARGTVFSSGAGLVVLKRLSDALADGDTVRAVLKGSAVNNDGAHKAGFTAPSLDGQAEVVARALALAGIPPETVGYVEAHGTGTPLGDPIEIAALTRAFRAGTRRRGFCAVGSVKSNIGHLDTAAGIAGLLKTVLALEHRQIPPTLHFERPNPRIDFADSPFYVAGRLLPWEAGETPRRAGVSSLGIGGTNAHVLVEEAPPPAETSPARPWQLLVLSAKTETALESATGRLDEHLRREPGQDLADVAFTLQAGRRAFPWRRALVCRGREDALAALARRDRFLDGRPREGSPAVAFLFPGQGSQRLGMGQQLHAAEPLFRREVDRCSEILRPHLGEDLRDLLFPPEALREEAARRLDRTAVTQPALFVVETALARLWISWGVRPQALLGHSVGEYVAAHLAGVMSLEDALALVAARGRLIEELPGGAMLAVPLPEPEVVPLLGAELSLAAVNGPFQCVVSGPEDAVERLRAELAGRGVEGRRLPASHAFHSRQMEALLEPFARRVRQVSLRPPEIPCLSNVTGGWLTPGEATDPAYWALHLRRTVRFADGLSGLLAEPDRVLLEVGPGRALTRLARRLCDLRGDRERVAVPSLAGEEAQPELAALYAGLGRLWTAGVAVDWSEFHAGERRRRVPLPTYPFERRRHWIEPVLAGRGAGPGLLEGEGTTFSLPSWRRSPPPPAPAAAGPGCCLLLLDACGLGEELAERLERSGQEVVRVAAGAARGLEDWAGLLAGLRREGRTLRSVVHLGSLTPSGGPAPDLDAAWSLGFASLAALTRALREGGAAEGVTITAVSNGVQRVTGLEDLHPAKATLLGWVRSAPLAGPAPRCRSLDVVLPAPGSARSRLADRLAAEVRAEAAEPVVAYRGDDRWVAALEPAPLGTPDRPASWLRPDGRYLVTGGLDGLSFALARRLAEAAPVRLAVAGPPGLAGSDRVRLLESLGAEILALEAEPAAREPLRTALARVAEVWGPLHGVFYLPGPGGAEEWMRGALALDSLLGDGEPEDFLVLFSWREPPPEVRARPEVWAAGALLDALAQARAARGASPTVALDWSGSAGLDSAEAFAALDRILAHLPAPQVAVSTPAVEPSRTATPPAGDPIPEDDPVALRIGAIWQEVLGLDRVGLHASFFDLGGDSLIALRLMARLREAFPLDLPVQALFDRPTVSGLRDAVESALTARLEELSEEEAQRLVAAFLD